LQIFRGKIIVIVVPSHLRNLPLLMTPPRLSVPDVRRIRGWFSQTNWQECALRRDVATFFDQAAWNSCRRFIPCSTSSRRQLISHWIETARSCDLDLFCIEPIMRDDLSHHFTGRMLHQRHPVCDAVCYHVMPTRDIGDTIMHGTAVADNEDGGLVNMVTATSDLFSACLYASEYLPATDREHGLIIYRTRIGGVPKPRQGEFPKRKDYFIHHRHEFLPMILLKIRRRYSPRLPRSLPPEASWRDRARLLYQKKIARIDRASKIEVWNLVRNELVYQEIRKYPSRSPPVIIRTNRGNLWAGAGPLREGSNPAEKDNPQSQTTEMEVESQRKPDLKGSAGPSKRKKVNN
jgi:hypothetical protein